MTLIVRVSKVLTDFANDVDHALVHGRVRAYLQEGVGPQLRLEEGDERRPLEDGVEVAQRVHRRHPRVGVGTFFLRVCCGGCGGAGNFVGRMFALPPRTFPGLIVGVRARSTTI